MKKIYAECQQTERWKASEYSVKSHLNSALSFKLLLSYAKMGSKGPRSGKTDDWKLLGPLEKEVVRSHGWQSVDLKSL